MASDAVLALDDINWSAGMRRAWETILRHERIALAVETKRIGLCAFSPGNRPKRFYRIH